MNNFLLVVFVALLNFAFAQDEIKYYNPPSFFTDIVKVDCDDIVSTEKLCKLKLIINNTSNNNFIVVNTKKVGFEYEGLGVYFPKKGKDIIFPPKNKKSRIIKIDGDMDYRVNSFKILVKSLREGKKENSIIFPLVKLEIGKSVETEKDQVNFIFEKSKSKKGKVSIDLTVKSSLKDDVLLNFNPEKFVIKDTKGNEIAYKINLKREFNFLGNAEKKYKISFESESSLFEVSSKNVFYLINLSPFDIKPFSISNGKTPQQPVVPNPPATSEIERCNSFIGQRSGPVEVLIMSDGNECFKLDVDDFRQTPTFSKVAKVYMNSGSHKFKIILESGIEVEKTVFIADTYSAVGYNIKAKKNGDYSINYLAFKQVLNEKGRRESLMNK